MSMHEAATLFMMMAILAVVPSTSVALVVTRSSTAGLAHGAAVAAGIVLGDLIFVLLAVLGMTALAELLGSLFLALRYLAGAYLIWFGITLLRSGAALKSAPSQSPATSLSTSLLSGLLITLGDVKAIFFYASLLPVFVDLSSIQAADIAMIATLTLVAVGGVKLGYALAARKVVILIKSPRLKRSTRLAAGGLMTGAGSYLLIKT